MRRSWAAATVGALAIVVGVITFILVTATREGTRNKKDYTVWAVFKDASGLFQKSRVQTAGIQVGQIEKRELDEQAQAKVTVRMQQNITLYENAEVSKKSASLLGEFYLEIFPGTPFGKDENTGVQRPMRKLVDGDKLRTVAEPTSVGDLLSSIGVILPILKDILADVRKMTSGPIAETAENVNRMIATNSVIVERLLTRVDHIAADVDRITDAEGNDVRVAIKNIRDITDSMKSLVGTGDSELKQTGATVRTSLEKLQASVDNLDKSLTSVQKITHRTEQGEGTIGHLLNDDTVARNIESITEDAGGFVRSITKLQTILGLRIEYNFLSRTFKEYISIQLLPRPDKFYLIEIVNDPRGFRETTSTTTISSTRGVEFSDSTTYSEKLRFTLQFGKTYGIVSGRFGIKESTGGLGTDFHLLGERLLLSVDVFDFKFNRYPRVQGRAQVAVWGRNLYVVGGVDDVANTRAKNGAGGGFDWFVGTQLVFNDEDLKSVLLFGGGAAAGATK